MHNPPPFPLSMALFQALSLQPAWQSAKQGLLNWSPHLQQEAECLIKTLQALPPAALHNALQQEVLEYCRGMSEGAKRYLESPVTLKKTPQPVIWQEGSSTLLDYSGNAPGYVVLCVPSLINRPYIFDLREEGSFLAFLTAQRIPAMLLDWGEPGTAEVGFTIEQYIGRLDRVVCHIHRHMGRKVILTGYCMGGMMALVSALHHPEAVAALALLATPWHFHAKDATRFTLTDTHIALLETWINSQATLPKEWIQMLFYLLYAKHIHKKYQSLAVLAPESEEAKELLAIEYWANDGINLASGAAKNCLIDWAYHNLPMQGKWYVGGKAIIPEQVTCPALVAIARHDRIASYHSALPLAEKIKGSKLLVADTGHVGMIAGRQAQRMLWDAFAAWIISKFR